MILSDPARTLRLMTVNPWQRLAEDWPRVPLIYEDFTDSHRWAESRWRNNKPVGIVLSSGLNQVERRCALTHELEHLDRGAPCGTLRATIERRVVVAAAKYLLPDLDLLAQHLAVYDLHRAADEMWVTFSVLVDRIKSLTDAELVYVTSRRESVA